MARHSVVALGLCIFSVLLAVCHFLPFLVCMYLVFLSCNCLLLDSATAVVSCGGLVNPVRIAMGVQAVLD